MEVMTVVESDPTQSSRQPWSPLTRIAFRFCFVYFGLYCLATQIILSVLIIPRVDLSDPATLAPCRAVVFWVGAHVFRLSTPLVYSDSGSGDKYYDWVLVFCLLIFAVMATAVWSVLDRKRKDYESLQKWFVLFLRFCLGGQMLVYGSVKAVPLQMPYPSLGRLVERFGDLSPMGMLWASVGAAPMYERLAGCAELLGGVLLMFPRTLMLGALVCVADLTEIFVLNMTYDVPVKQFSFHLILISLLLLGPYFRRLADFFVFNRPTQAWQPAALFRTARARRIAGACIAFLWIWMAGNNVYGAWQGWHEFGGGAAKTPLYGIWNIQKYTLDGKPQSLLVTEAQLWRGIVFDYPQFAKVEMMDGSLRLGVALDAKAATVTLTKPGDKNWQAHFTYSRPTFEHLVLDGTLDGHRATLDLERVDEKKFLLTSRGFHWIQDYPFNR